MTSPGSNPGIPQVSQRSALLRIVAWQAGLSLLLAAGWWIRDANAAVSALAGGAICFLPAGLFALRLKRAQHRQDGYVFAFFAGEAIKILLSIALFVGAAVFYKGADWLALLVTYIVVLQVYVFGLLMASR
jgi:ATP synthase protein I